MRITLESFLAFRAASMTSISGSTLITMHKNINLKNRHPVMFTVSAITTHLPMYSHLTLAK